MIWKNFQLASIRHELLSEKEQKQSGILPNLIRISVGLKPIEDIKNDFEQAFAKLI